MTPDIVGYLFDLLDPDDRRQVESAVRADPALRLRLDRVRRSLAPLQADLPAELPAPGLAGRTLAFVAAHADFPPPDNRPTPARRPELLGDREPVFLPSRWRRPD